MFVSINRRDIIEEICGQPMNYAHVSFSPFQQNLQTVRKDLKAKWPVCVDYAEIKPENANI